uniref:AAA family ATPase n=1 Tax=Lactococcus sp. TaxID=44273 RepID=UPI003242CC78
MGILIKELRIRNYKCYESLDVELNETSLLLGANNAGKTSLLEALELSFTRYKRISEELIFIKKDEVLNKDKEIIIDVLILPNEESFDEEWFNWFCCKV